MHALCKVENLRAILTPANLYLVKIRFVGLYMYFKEYFYALLKIPVGTKINFYQETGIFNIFLKKVYVYIFKK